MISCLHFYKYVCTLWCLAYFQFVLKLNLIKHFLKVSCIRSLKIFKSDLEMSSFVCRKEKKNLKCNF